MRIVIVAESEKVQRRTEQKIRSTIIDVDIKIFSNPKQALTYLQSQDVDLIFAQKDMQQMPVFEFIDLAGTYCENSDISMIVPETGSSSETGVKGADLPASGQNLQRDLVGIVLDRYIQVDG